MIARDQAARIARRLERHYRKADPLLGSGMVTRLWGLLETAPNAREAYGCPPNATLREHARTLTPDDLDRAANRLERGTAITPLATDSRRERGATE